MGGRMARFITLAKFHDTGELKLGDLVDDVGGALTGDTIDGELVDVYLTLGGFDLVVVAEMGGRESAAAFACLLREMAGGDTMTLTTLDVAAIDQAMPQARDAVGRPAVGRPAVGRGDRTPNPQEADG